MRMGLRLPVLADIPMHVEIGDHALVDELGFDKVAGKRVLELDEHGKPLTIWDGRTMKIHPVTGNLVPDETGRMEIYRYIKPRATKWPKANFIVGNPPFIGNKKMRERLGDGYTEAVRQAHSAVGDGVDFVMFWWALSASALKAGKLRRFGFITTNSITQVSNRVVIDQSGARLVFAIADHPWIDANDGASVGIALSCATSEQTKPQFYKVVTKGLMDDGTGEFWVELSGGVVSTINSDLSKGAAANSASALKSNLNLSFMGVIPKGKAFQISPLQMAEFGLSTDDENPVVKPYLNGSDLTDAKPHRLILDFYGFDENQILARSPSAYQHLLNGLKPDRTARAGVTADSQQYASKWWAYAKPRPEMRKALKGLKRYIATVETAKHRWFTFLDTRILPDQKIRVVASDDAYLAGVLSSRFHVIWALATGGLVGPTPTWTNTTCFDPFPFPADVPEPLKDKIRAEAEALDALRKRVLAEHEELTLTKLYNVLEALKHGRALTDVERGIHDKGLVTLICQHHDAIDALVAQAYGWEVDLADEDILTRLVALNKARAAEEAKGVIRWLRPEYQAPDYTAPVNATLDLGEAAAPVPDNIIPWPEKLPDQVSAVAAILSGAGIPLAPQDVARNFKGKRAATVQPVLEALAGIGMARRLKDGRYAA